MRDCERLDLRDALPELMHDRLPAAEREALFAHVGACAECEAELELLRATRDTFVASVPRVDASAIARGVQRELAAGAARSVDAPSAQPMLRVIRGDAPSRPMPARRRSIWTGTPMRIAAGVTLAALGVGGVLRSKGVPQTVAIQQPVAAGPSASPAAAQPTIAPVPAPTIVAQVDTPDTPTRSTARPAASTLGATFADLSDDELDQIVRSLDADDGALPLDPEPIGSAVKLTGNPR